MKKYRISTTISQSHHDLMIKHAEKFDSQQRLIEHALECLDKASKARSPMSREEEIWMRIGRELKTGVVVFQKDIIRLITDTVDLEEHSIFIAKQKPYEFAVEYYYQKPLKDCTLPEIMEAIVLIIKFQNSYETVNYTDEGNYYMLSLTHKWGLKFSQVMEMMCGSIFESYGVRVESRISDISMFAKVYKK